MEVSLPCLTPNTNITMFTMDKGKMGNLSIHYPFIPHPRISLPEMQEKGVGRQKCRVINKRVRAEGRPGNCCKARARKAQPVELGIISSIMEARQQLLFCVGFC